MNTIHTPQKESSAILEVREVFSKHFPLVANGIIELRAIGRMNGRILIGVASKDTSIDPISIITNTVTVLEQIESELNGDKLSITLLNETTPERFFSIMSDEMYSTLESTSFDASSNTATITIDGGKASLDDYQNSLIPMFEEFTGWKIVVV